LRATINSGLTVEEKLHRPSYKMQWGGEKYLEKWEEKGGL
jgi:hypothetical protein